VSGRVRAQCVSGNRAGVMQARDIRTFPASEIRARADVTGNAIGEAPVKARGLSVTTIPYRSDHGHRFASPMRSFLRLTTDDGAPSVLGILIGLVAPAIVVLTIIAVAIARY
jgi:hypothetical protein